MRSKFIFFSLSIYIYILIYGLTYRGEGNGTKGAIGPKGEKGDKGEGPFVPKGPIGRYIIIPRTMKSI